MPDFSLTVKHLVNGIFCHSYIYHKVVCKLRWSVEKGTSYLNWKRFERRGKDFEITFTLQNWKFLLILFFAFINDSLRVFNARQNLTRNSKTRNNPFLTTDKTPVCKIILFKRLLTQLLFNLMANVFLFKTSCKWLISVCDLQKVGCNLKHTKQQSKN